MQQHPFSDILNESLDRLSQGATVEECLAAYRDWAQELEPLLRAALILQAVSVPSRPEAKQAILARVTQAWQQQEARRHGPSFSFPSLGVWRPWLATAAAVLVLALGGWTTASAAADSMPGQPLYPIKETQERLLLALTLGAQDKAQLHAHLAGERGREMARLAAQGPDTRHLRMLALRMTEHTQQALVLLEVQIPPAPPLAPAAAPTAPPGERQILSAPIPPPQRPQLHGPRSAKRRQALAELREALREEAKEHDERYRSLPPDKQGQAQDAYRESRQELEQAVSILVQVTASAGDEEDDGEKAGKERGRGRKRGRSND